MYRPPLAAMVVVTGSRGSMIALLLALLVFFLHGRSLKLKLKVGLVVLFTVGLLAWLSYEIEPVRERWERTYYEGDTAGRDAIFSAAWEMFLEKPIAGWGPANHIYEVGSRLGLYTVRDTHNVILWILTESGLLGAVPFFAGFWLCWCAAWNARHGIQGALPMSLVLFVLVRAMSGSDNYDKLFWFVLAYALSGASYVTVRWPKHTQVYSAHSSSGKPARLQNPPEVAA